MCHIGSQGYVPYVAVLKTEYMSHSFIEKNRHLQTKQRFKRR